MQKRYATAEEILAASDAYRARTGAPTMNDVIEGRAPRDPAWTRKLLRDFEAVCRVIDRENRTLEAEQGARDIGLAIGALIDNGTVYTPEVRSTAARWVADALIGPRGGLPGHPGAQDEVYRRLEALARREGFRGRELDRRMGELLRELVLGAIREAVQRRQILKSPARVDTLEKRMALANGILAVVRRELRQALVSDDRLRAARDALRAEPELLSPLPAERDLEEHLAAALEAAPLTPRQRDVLEALAQTGCDRAAAAARLGLSESRVRAYLAEIRARTTARTP